MDREQLAKEIFIADNGRLSRDVAEQEWAESTPAHRIYAYAIADRMAQLIQAAKAEAWDTGVSTALNHAILNEDGITLRLEHLDGRPWANPYAATS